MNRIVELGLGAIETTNGIHITGEIQGPFCCTIHEKYSVVCEQTVWGMSFHQCVLVARGCVTIDIVLPYSDIEGFTKYIQDIKSSCIDEAIFRYKMRRNVREGD